MTFKSLIETQFPVSKISAESYKERDAKQSQTLTRLGKWWGRKPLILVRATILGLLLPSSDNPKKDREIFLKLLTMDDDGLLRRKAKSIPVSILVENLSPTEKETFFEKTDSTSSAKWKKGVSRSEKEDVQRKVFLRLPYSERLQFCDRPEQIAGPSEEAWSEINKHLGTSAKSLSELVQELGAREFGHTPKVGDAFCGGGSIPFEAARIGADAYAADLNPVACLLSWAGLNAMGAKEEVVRKLVEGQEKILADVETRVRKMGIELSDEGWRAEAYLYCCEARCPETGWLVPLAPSWVIGEKSRCIARLVPVENEKRYDILIESGVSDEAMEAAKRSGTVKDGRLIHPKAQHGTPISVLRGDRRGPDGPIYGLRLWENEDLVPRATDVFQERLYCIKWIVETEQRGTDGTTEKVTRKQYRAPTQKDLQREKEVLEILTARFANWQELGFLPRRKIESGDETDRLYRERGWTHWHHLFNPRQLLVLGLFAEVIASRPDLTQAEKVVGLLGLGKCVDYNARLSRWHSHGDNEKSEQVFSDQALNTLFNYGVRTTSSLKTSFLVPLASQAIPGVGKVEPIDVREITHSCDLWITDPPYADAINYHELTEFFLAWYSGPLKRIFPSWYDDTKRSLAVRGSDSRFKTSMVAAYKNLAERMSDNGAQVVMFTHQNAAVWADLTLILWASGLRVSSAWCIATETSTALKTGNYVQGTVLLVLRKQTSNETAFLDELYPKVEEEVKIQLREMLALEDESDPNFGDADYQLAAYAAALRILTQYRSIEDIDIARELSKDREKGNPSPVEAIISNAVKVACDYLVPRGIDPFTWKNLSGEEKLYLKGLEVESHKEYRAGVYQELARGFGIKEYRNLLSTEKANQTRLKTASEFGNRMLDATGFGSSLVRHTLFAISEISKADDVQAGKSWLRTELRDYWNNRRHLIEVCKYLAGVSSGMESWNKDVQSARLLAGALENDHA